MEVSSERHICALTSTTLKRGIGLTEDAIMMIK